MAFLTLFFVGCDSPERELSGSAAATQHEKEPLDNPDPLTTEIAETTPPPREPVDETETDGWNTVETTEDPGCYYAEGLHIEVAAAAQLHAEDLAECSETLPLDPNSSTYALAYKRYHQCVYEATHYYLPIRRNNVIENCFDKDTNWFHVDYCANMLGHQAIFDCLNASAGSPDYVNTWDTCKALRDTRYDDAIASGECDV